MVPRRCSARGAGVTWAVALAAAFALAGGARRAAAAPAETNAEEFAPGTADGTLAGAGASWLADCAGPAIPAADLLLDARQHSLFRSGREKTAQRKAREVVAQLDVTARAKGSRHRWTLANALGWRSTDLRHVKRGVVDVVIAEVGRLSGQSTEPDFLQVVSVTVKTNMAAETLVVDVEALTGAADEHWPSLEEFKRLEDCRGGAPAVDGTATATRKGV